MKVMVIPAAVAGTPQQPPVPKNEFALVEAGAVEYDQSQSAPVKLCSAAGVATYNLYWQMVNSLNPGIWNNHSTNPDSVATSAALTNSSQQEWIGNPASGHNVAVGS